MKRNCLILIAGLLSIVFAHQAFAIPALQVYIPGAEYVDETWITDASSFDVSVIASQDVRDVFLTISVEGQGNISLNNQDLTGFVYGNPGYGGHGEFDTYYVDYSIGDMIVNNSTIVYDMAGTPGAGKAGGKIVTFAINVTGYDSVHFDAHGDGWKKNGKVNTFAPYSHDAGTGAPVPEPATMSLLGMGVLGLLGLRRRKQ